MREVSNGINHSLATQDIEDGRKERSRAIRDMCGGAWLFVCVY